MKANLKFYLLAAFFVAAITGGGIIIFQQHEKIQAQGEAFKVFKKTSEDQRAKILREIDSVKLIDKAQGEAIDAAQGDRKTYRDQLEKFKKQYEKDRLNFRAFNNDSLADYFAKRRAARYP